MALFEVPKRATKSNDMKIAKKSNTKAIATPTTIKGGGSLIDRINLIKSMVETNLGKYKEEYQVINDKDILHDFITECIGNGYISIDTETDGLDPLQNTLAGICPYTYGQKGAYIPLNHISYITNEKASGQLEMEFVMSEFKRLLDKKPEIDMFNAKFDIRFLRANGLHNIYCTWDGYLASRLLNENEEHKNLKQLHNKYCLDGKGDAFRFDDLFKGIPFTMIPYNVGYLYAAHDPHITTELCDYQRKWLREDSDREDMQKLYWVFKNIEMPCVPVICDMEDNGILFDMNYQQQLSEKYNKLLEEKKRDFYKMCGGFVGEDIWAYKKQNPNNKLDDPINISSPTQLAILFYDILKCPVIDKKSPRGTGVEILSKMDNPLAKAILEYRAIEKQINTYIDKLPNCVNPNDGRIHCSFNQYGADTGRMSSSDPNLQNISSHNKDIRKMFVASDGYVLLSSDYSAQEPRLMAQLCGDRQMIQSYIDDKDLYSQIASIAFNTTYEECLEHFPKDTPIKKRGDKWYYATLDDYDKLADGKTDTYNDGKERRTSSKSILLGILYGRGINSVAEQLHTTKEKAQNIQDKIFKGFPAIKQFEQDSLDMAYELGYVTTFWGGKRRLPDLQLDEYEFKWKDGVPPQDDLLDFDVDDEPQDIPEEKINKYLRKLKRAWGSQKRNIIEQAKNEGITIIDNGGKIADATRQCVNARIQGSAAQLTKLAMIKLNKDERLKELGFRMLIPVHDEIIAECPIENAKEVSERFSQLMIEAGSDMEVPSKCDVTITKCWYGEEIEV